MQQAALQGQLEGRVTSPFSPYVRGEGFEEKKAMTMQTTMPESKAASGADGSTPFASLFRKASGDWRTLCDDGDWWVAGHHFVYPATDRDHAERLCRELSNEHLQSLSQS